MSRRLSTHWARSGEIVNGLRAFANRRRLSIDAVEAVVKATLEHGLTYLEVIGEARRAEDRAHPRQGLRVCARTPSPLAPYSSTCSNASARLHAAGGAGPDH